MKPGRTVQRALAFLDMTSPEDTGEPNYALKRARRIFILTSAAERELALGYVPRDFRRLVEYNLMLMLARELSVAPAERWTSLLERVPFELNEDVRALARSYAAVRARFS